ncbi:hypothetical protein D3C85_1048860 [compost metagenome]
MPPRVIIAEKIAKNTMQVLNGMPVIVSMAIAPRKKIEVKFTNTYTSNQKTAIKVLTVLL